MTGTPQLTELDLIVAATPFFRPRETPSIDQRRQLRHAVFEFLRQREAIPPSTVIGSSDEALAALQALLKRCEELKVDWTDVVACVNREYIAPKSEAVS